MIYFRCYIEAYESATRDLSMLEDGAYLRLLRHYYLTELPLPHNSDKLARICKAISVEERAAIEAVLGRFFTREHDGWHNSRADHEIAVSKTARTNGSRGGRPSESETETQTGCSTGIETDSRAGSGHPSSLSTKTTLPPSQPTTQPPSDDAPRRGRKAPPVDTKAVWDAYSAAHFDRYGVQPVRNARVNGQLASVVRCVGAKEAPAVAAFFVAHNRSHYVAAKHATSLLARDAEGLRTEWATKRTVTDTEARQTDRTQAVGNVFTQLIAENAR